MNSVPVRILNMLPPTFQLSAEDELDTCPYNNSHYCLKRKRSQHVDKCRRAYVDRNTSENQSIDLFECKYTSIHRIPLVEIAYHQVRCPWKNNPQYLFPEYQPSAPAPRPKETFSRIKSLHLKDLNVRQLEALLLEYKLQGRENWDAELALQNKTRSRFNPMKNIIEGSVPWQPIGLTKSEAKKFREVYHDVANLERGGSYDEVAALPVPKKNRCGASFPVFS